MNRMTGRKIVFTIHGINSDGEWQDHVQRILEPHFRCVPLRYRHFRRLGWIKALMGRPLTRPAVGAVADQYAAEVQPYGRKPDLIAHSFGTLVAARLMELPAFQFDRVIFLGSPLPCNFDWQRILDQNPQAFQQLTNEAGMEDRVIRLAGAAGKIFTHLGDAGRKGFAGPSTFVHDLEESPQRCSECAEMVRRGGTPARLHNLVWSRYQHHDWFIGKGHHANLWLPYLWGIEPGEYSDFINLCLQAAELEATDRLRELLDCEDRLRSSSWSWTHDDTLISHLNADVEAYFEYREIDVDPAVVRNICSRAVRLVWVNVQEAVHERAKESAGQRPAIVRRLYPPIAVGSAVRAAAETIVADQ